MALLSSGCDANTFSLVRDAKWIWLGWGVGWSWERCSLSTLSVVQYWNTGFNYITWLCSEAQLCQNGISLSFISCVSVCLEFYLPISRSVLLFTILVSNWMLLGPFSTELFLYLLITELAKCETPFNIRDLYSSEGIKGRTKLDFQARRLFLKKCHQFAKQIQLFGTTQTQTWDSHCILYTISKAAKHLEGQYFKAGWIYLSSVVRLNTAR